MIIVFHLLLAYSSQPMYSRGGATLLQASGEWAMSGNEYDTFVGDQAFGLEKVLQTFILHMAPYKVDYGDTPVSVLDFFYPLMIGWG